MQAGPRRTAACRTRFDLPGRDEIKSPNSASTSCGRKRHWRAFEMINWGFHLTFEEGSACRSRAILSSSALSDAMLPELPRRLCLPEILSGHDDFGSRTGSAQPFRQEFAQKMDLKHDHKAMPLTSRGCILVTCILAVVHSDGDDGALPPRLTDNTASHLDSAATSVPHRTTFERTRLLSMSAMADTTRRAEGGDPWPYRRSLLKGNTSRRALVQVLAQR